MRLLSADEVLPLVARLDVVAPGVRADLLDDASCGAPLRVYIALTDGRLGQGLSEEDRLYNRYHWFLRFAQAHRAKFGADAGIDQQASRILQHAECEVDRQQIAQLEAAVLPGS